MLGKGTYGQVREIDGEAVKTLNSFDPKDGCDVSMLKERVAHTALAGAPNVARCLRFGDGGRSLHLELAEGTLSEMPRDRISVKEAMVQLCRGLAAIHARGIIHNDIKPSNILYKGNELAYIDFGMSIFSDYARCRPRSGRTTDLYEAPEQKLFARASQESDVFSLAITICEWQRGRAPRCSPFSAICGAQSREDVALAMRERSARALLNSITVDIEGVPPKCAALLNMMLSSDWESRPSAAVCLYELSGEVLLPHVSPVRPAGQYPAYLDASIKWLLGEIKRVASPNISDREWALLQPLVADLLWRAKTVAGLDVTDETGATCASLAIKLHAGVAVPAQQICYAAGAREYELLGKWEETLLDKLGFALHVPEQDIYK